MAGGYKVGVSSGWFSIAKAQELLGLAQKTASITTYGVNYVQVDFENTSEFFEPDVIERLRHVMESLQINWGAHGEIGEMMGWEGALEVIWKQSHRRLHQYLDGLYDFFIKGTGQREGKDYTKYKPEYINFHASNMPPIGLFVERFRYAGHTMFDFKGRENWDELFSENKKLKDWFLRDMVMNLFARESGVALFSEEQVLEQGAKHARGIELDKEVKEGKITKEEANSKLHGEEGLKYVNEKIEKYNQGDDDVKEQIHEALYQVWLQFSPLKNIKGAISIEEWAYAIVAKYLEIEKDNPKEPLWKSFFGNKSMDDLEREWSTEAKDGKEAKKIKLFDKNRGVVNLMPELVAMVAARYIIGHFDADPLPEFIRDRKLKYEREERDWDPFYEKTAMEKLNIVKVIFAFETPEIIENQREGLQRIIHARHIYKLVKAFNNPNVKGIFDSEHYVSNGFNPLDEIRSCPDDMGKYFVGFHVGAPKPYHPSHEPIDVGSEAQRWTYIYAYEMRKKGFGVDDEAIIIFERGGARGGQSPVNFVGQSATAVKAIAEELKKDTSPENLPMSFFGVSPEGLHSVERQMAMIREHYWDPLKGMLSVPEEEHMFFGKAALDKGKKGDEFKKQELR